MSLDWKLQRSLGSRPQNLMRFLAISLLLHGVVFLGLETYLRWSVNHPLQTEKEAMIPVKFIQVPANAVKPPADAKLRASSNSTAGGKARPELPVATGASSARPTTRLRSSQPTSTESTSTAEPSQPDDSPQQPEPAPSRDRLPLTDGETKISRPVPRTKPKPTSRSRQSSRQNASFLGGPVNRASNELLGYGGDEFSNANRPGPGSQGVDARKQVDLGAYLDRLKQQVKQQWHPELSNSSQHTIISFSVNRTGQVSNLRILKHSGSTLTDQAELQAIERAAPFEPLPEGYQADQLYIDFSFNQIQF